MAGVAELEGEGRRPEAPAVAERRRESDAGLEVHLIDLEPLGSRISAMEGKSVREIVVAAAIPEEGGEDGAA